MSYQEILDKIKPNLEKALEFFKEQLKEIRTGGVSAGFIENLKVDCFDSVLSLKQLGAISVPSPQKILVQLWDKSYLEQVIKAIEQENLGFSINIDGNNVYLLAPPLTEENKKILIKFLNKRKEEIFQNIRHIRDDGWKEIQDGFQKSEIREDDKYRGKDELEELIRDYREKIEVLVENKEKEIQR